jgi:hypothetical protein
LIVLLLSQNMLKPGGRVHIRARLEALKKKADNETRVLFPGQYRLSASAS